MATSKDYTRILLKLVDTYMENNGLEETVMWLYCSADLDAQTIANILDMKKEKIQEIMNRNI